MSWITVIVIYLIVGAVVVRGELGDVWTHWRLQYGDPLAALILPLFALAIIIGWPGVALIGVFTHLQERREQMFSVDYDDEEFIPTVRNPAVWPSDQGKPPS